MAVAVLVGAASCAFAVTIANRMGSEAYVGTEYFGMLVALNVSSAQGGYLGLSWMHGGEIPPGLKFERPISGEYDLKGTPTQAGTYSFYVTVYNGVYSATEYCTITVHPSGSGSNGGGSDTPSNDGGGTSGNSGESNNASSGAGSSGGGCDSGFGILGLALLFFLRKK